MAVYDQQQETGTPLIPSDDGSHDNLGVHPEQREAQNQQLEDQFKQPSHDPGLAALAKSEGHPVSNENADGASNARSLAPEELSAGEALGNSANAAVTSDQVGVNGFVNNGAGSNPAAKSTVHRVFGNVKQHKKGIFLGVGTTGGIVALSVAAIVALLPLKIESIVNNLEDDGDSTSMNALEGEDNSLFGGYVEKFVGPSLTRKSCGTTIDAGCTVNVFGDGSNPVINLYKTWSQAKLENRLAVNYGIEIKYDSASKTYYLKTPQTTGEGDALNDPKNPADFDANHNPIIDADMFREADVGEVRTAINNGLENETKLKEIWYRYKYGRFLEEKYSITRFVPSAIQDFANEKKNAAQLFLVQHVLVPRAQNLGIAMECLIDPTCSPTTTTPGGDPATEAGSVPESETEGEMAQSMQTLAEKYALDNPEDVQALIDIYNQISEKGYSNFVISQTLSKLGLEDLSSNVADAAPIINWVTIGSQIISAAGKVGTTVKKLSYVTNAAAAVSLYMAYRSFADQIHSGNVSTSEVDSFSGALGDGTQGATSTDPEVGGTASAEESPLYADVIDGDSPATANTSTTANSIIGSLLSSKAYAATSAAATVTKSSTDLCSNGSPPTGEICPEEVLNAGNGAASSVTSFLHSPVLAPFTAVAGAISKVSGAIGGIFGKLFSDILGPLGFNDLTSLISKAIQPLFKAATSVLFPDPFGNSMSGARKFDMMAAGATVAGADTAHNVEGGAALTSTQAAEITQQQEDAAQQQFESQSFFARMFSTDSQYSLISRLAVDIPFGSVSSLTESGVGNMLSDPFGKILSSFGAIFSMKSFAQSTQGTLCPGPFGVTCYGYTQAQLDAIGDPATYWQTHDCSDTSTNGPNYAWNKAASTTLDPNTDMPENTQTDPCLLIQAAVGAGGGYLDTSNLSADDLADVGGGGGPTSPTTSTTSTGNAPQLAQQILANSNIDLTCLSSSVQQDVQDAANNQPGTAGAMTSAGILQLIATVGQSHKVCVTAIQSDGQGHCNGETKAQCPNDPHYTGNAVDFGSLDGTAITGRNAPALTIMQIAEGVFSTGAFGQSQCGATPPLPSGWSDFEDTCNHLHVQNIAAGSD